MKNCKHCGETITTGDKRKIFCGSSCAAKFNNKKYPKRIAAERPNCLNCGQPTKRVNSLCCTIQCKNDYERKLYVERWKQGLETGTTGVYDNISRHIRRYFHEKQKSKCSECGWGIKNEYTNSIPLEIDHIDGNYKNNKETNLRLICPNCHALTKNYRGANKGNGRTHLKEKKQAGYFYLR